MGPTSIAERLGADPLLKIREACELARVSRRTLYNWMNDGKVEYVVTASGSRRIVSASLFRRVEVST